MSIIGSLATWYFWAYYAAGLTIMSCVLAIHLRTTRLQRRAPWLLVVGGLLGALGSVIGGMQAGPYPPLEAATGVAVIRLCWVTGITLGLVAAALYLWTRKIKRT